jgi:hypothetical protein
LAQLFSGQPTALDWVVLGFALAAMAGEAWRLKKPKVRRKRRRRRPLSHRVVMDGQGLRSSHPQRQDEAVRWSQVVRVSVVTTERSSKPPYLFLLLHEPGGLGASVPYGAPGFEDLLRRLAEIPEFDMQAVLDAQQHDGDDVFPCWQGQGLPFGEVVPDSALHLVE